MADSPFVARWHHVTQSDHIAIDDGKEQVSFSELGRRAARAAAVLRRGEPSLQGRRVALLVTQGSAWVEAFMGIILAGGRALPLSPLYPPAELAYFVADAEVDAIVVSPEFSERTRSFSEGRRIVEVDALRSIGGPAPCPDLSASDIALMLYTSGTTGRPKGAMITHANLAVQAELLHRAWGWQPDDVLLHALPLHHLHGLGISLLTALLGGAKARMLERFDATAVWDLFGEATVFMGVPTMYQKLLDTFDASEPSARTRWSASARGLRLSTSGSAALPVKLSERWRALFGTYPLERFGMTEIGVGMTNPLDGERRAGSVGKPLPTVGFRIVDSTGTDVKEGDPGEIWINGPSVFAGYWKRDEITRACFSDGWFKTGDTALRDPSGYVRILGRTSVDILKSGGYKLSALEIEDVLREHDAVAEVAVIGLPDETWGELVVAAIVPRAGREHEIQDAPMRAWAKERLSSYKVPRRFVALPSLPRNPVGKVQKPELLRLLTRSR